jgi:hypothetical protein
MIRPVVRSSTIQYRSVSDRPDCGLYDPDRERSPAARTSDARAQVETVVPLSPRACYGTPIGTQPRTPMGTLPPERCRRDAVSPRIYVKEGAILRVWVPFSQGPLVRSGVGPKCFAFTRPSSDDSFVRLLGWWYICIGLAFILLAARAFVSGAPAWSSWLRVAIAVGFVLLGIFELRRVGSRRR